MKKKIIIAIVAIILVLCVASAVIVPSLLKSKDSDTTTAEETTEQLAEVDTKIEDTEDNKEATTVDKAETSEGSTEQIVETADNNVAGSSNTNQNKTETSKNNTQSTSGSKSQSTNSTSGNTSSSTTGSKTNNNTTSNTNGNTTHTHNWVKVVDSKAYDEYEEVPVYEMQEVTDYDNIVQTKYVMMNGMDAWAMSMSEAFAWEEQHCPIDYPDCPDPLYVDGRAVCIQNNCRTEYVYGTKMEKVQVGTEKKFVAHHNEEYHHECSCGAVKVKIDGSDVVFYPF